MSTGVSSSVAEHSTGNREVPGSIPGSLLLTSMLHHQVMSLYYALGGSIAPSFAATRFLIAYVRTAAATDAHCSRTSVVAPGSTSICESVRFLPFFYLSTTTTTYIPSTHGTRYLPTHMRGSFRANSSACLPCLTIQNGGFTDE